MADIHADYSPTAQEIEAMEPRILAFIMPNEPRSNREREAFDRAVVAQCVHEYTHGGEFGAIPDGVQSYTVGNFSMEFGQGQSLQLSRHTLCPTAYGLLLTAGLLYRGLERRG